MNRIIAFVLVLCLLLTGCGTPGSRDLSRTSTEDVTTDENNGLVENIDDVDDGLGDQDADFPALNDDNLLQYVVDDIYAELELSLPSDNYKIEDVSAVYISKEYLEELSYNSLTNIYFGFSEDELAERFGDQAYIFTCDDNGNTIVKPYEKYDDTYERALRNIAIGTGVILVCVTVSVVTGGVGATAVSAVFMASAKTGAAFALSSGAISGATTAIVTGFTTHDFQQTVQAAALSASESFKWGAITGAVVGGAQEAITLGKAAKAIPTPEESEAFALKKYGGKEQISYLDGKEVPKNTLNATRPDVIVQNADGTIQAIEVKNINLANRSNRSALYQKLEKQIADRVKNLPKGSTQKIVIDARNRGFTQELLDNVKNQIQLHLADIYPNIPIEVLT